MSYSTRTLLAITFWFALCYAMVFSIPPNLLVFYVFRFVVYFLFTLSLILPLFLPLKHQRLGIAYSFTGFGLLLFTIMENTSNPVAGHLAETIFRIGEFKEPSLTDFGDVNHVNGTIGQFLCLYYVVELHVVILLAILSGLLWQWLSDKTPFWLAGVSCFAWLFVFSMEFTGVGMGWFLFAEFVAVFVFVSILPGVTIYQGTMRPFWTAFSLAGCAISIQLSLTSPFEFAVAKFVLASVWEEGNVNAAKQLLVVISPIMALVAGVATQAIVVGFAGQDSRAVSQSRSD